MGLPINHFFYLFSLLILSSLITYLITIKFFPRKATSSLDVIGQEFTKEKLTYLLLLLRNEIATKEAFIAEGNRQLSVAGNWTWDRFEALKFYDKDIDEIKDKIEKYLTP
jgi:hypothetical protein